MGNVILIGMPGSGKSTLGVLLAKAIGFSFIDTDLIISRRAGKPLQRILNEDGIERFLSLEEEIGSALECDFTVVATGGSMVLSERAMKHLGGLGRVVYIRVAPEEIKRRVKNITTRGIVFGKGESLDEVYRSRAPLYESYAGLTVDFGDGADIEEAVQRLAETLGLAGL